MPRPKLKDDDKTSLIQVAVRVSKEDATKLDYICASTKTRRTDFIRRAIRDEFERLTARPVADSPPVDDSAPVILCEGEPSGSDPREDAEAVDEFRAVDLLRIFGGVVPVDAPEELQLKERARELGTLATALDRARKPLDDNGAIFL